MLPTHRRPTTPGEILRIEFLEELGMSQVALAERMGLHVQAINPIITGRRAITAEMAVRLSEVLGTEPEFWMNLQAKVDLWDALQKRRESAARPKPSRSSAKRAASR